MSVGHDHNNDYHGEYEGITLSYGRKTGYSCYGPSNLLHGARVFELTLEPYSIKSWIREESGDKIEYSKKHTKSFFQPKQ